MRFTFKGTVRGKVIITDKGMLRIIVMCMLRINGKFIVRWMLIITLKGMVKTDCQIYTRFVHQSLCCATPLTGLPTDAVSIRKCLDMTA